MIKYVLLTLSVITCICLSTANAEWIETEGTAQIKSGDISTARSQAIDEALRQAMLESGAFITSEQNFDEGIIKNDNFNIAASNNLRQYNIVSEQQKDNFFIVKIRVFIESTNQICNAANYKKTILPVLFIYGPNQYQQSIDGLNDINVSVTQKLSSIMNDGKQIIRPLFVKNLGLDPSLLKPSSEKISSSIKHLGREYDTQYIILGVIRDLSITPPDGNILSQMFKDPYRNFSISIYTMNAISGDVVYNKDYTSTAKWDLSSTHNDVNSSAFWHSTYGLTITEILKKANDDIQQTIACQKIIGKIIKIDQDTGYVYTNLGNINGIKQGNRFFIEHEYEFIDQDGTQRIANQRAKAQLEAIEVFKNTSLLKPVLESNGNIQINDLIILE
ncbi:MAG: flagellar assembly protein T N-terminal domain-containing protein [Succinivibrionaceae bacterium]